MSYRIWWLIACCAVVIGLAIEADTPAERQAAESAAASAATTALAARLRHDRGA